MVASVIFGLALIHFGGGLSQIWLHVKLTLILVMIAYHFFLLKCLKKFAEDKNNYEEKFFRIINEVPAILMIIIVFLVVLKPF
jgi:putative membrane protein